MATTYTLTVNIESAGTQSIEENGATGSSTAFSFSRSHRLSMGMHISTKKTR